MGWQANRPTPASQPNHPPKTGACLPEICPSGEEPPEANDHALRGTHETFNALRGTLETLNVLWVPLRASGPGQSPFSRSVSNFPSTMDTASSLTRVL